MTEQEAQAAQQEWAIEMAKRQQAQRSVCLKLKKSSDRLPGHLNVKLSIAGGNKNTRFQLTKKEMYMVKIKRGAEKASRRAKWIFVVACISLLVTILGIGGCAGPWRHATEPHASEQCSRENQGLLELKYRS